MPKTSTALEFTLIDKESAIGNYTFINRFCEITKSRIGNYCSIGSSVRIGPGEHDLMELSTSSVVTGHTARELAKGNCIIGHDVWIGTGAFVKRGVTVGIGAVIGAGSVVTKDVPSYAIVAGVPAKIIRMRFPPDVVAALLASKWWEHEPEVARNILGRLVKQAGVVHD